MSKKHRDLGNGNKQQKTPNGAKGRKTVQQEGGEPHLREFIDLVAAGEVPPYDHLCPAFDGHFLADDSGLRELAQAKVIVATRDSTESPIVLFGREEFERARAAGEETA